MHIRIISNMPVASKAQLVVAAAVLWAGKKSIKNLDITIQKHNQGSQKVPSKKETYKQMQKYLIIERFGEKL